MHVFDRTSVSLFAYRANLFEIDDISESAYSMNMNAMGHLSKPMLSTQTSAS